MLRAFLSTVSALLFAILIVGCKANPPGKVESAVMLWAKHKILVQNKAEKSPLQDNAAELADGKEAFSHYCTACHGLDGQNIGVPFADRMPPPVGSLGEPEMYSH
jgi:mono/diheme cytochrome c family protein